MSWALVFIACIFFSLYEIDWASCHWGRCCRAYCDWVGSYTCRFSNARASSASSILILLPGLSCDRWPTENVPFSQSVLRARYGQLLTPKRAVAQTHLLSGLILLESQKSLVRLGPLSPWHRHNIHPSHVASYSPNKAHVFKCHFGAQMKQNSAVYVAMQWDKRKLCFFDRLEVHFCNHVMNTGVVIWSLL